MTDQTPTNGSATHAADERPAAPIEAAGADIQPGLLLTNADVAALSRERLQTLLAVLPPAVAAILITNRPPMPPQVEYDAHRKLVAALAKARAKIPSIPMDKTVDYVSKRTGERIHYTFASLDSIHKTVTGPLSEHGLVLECIFNGDVIVMLLSHEEGGIHLSWLPLPDEPDIKDLATQITMRRRYLTNQLIAVVADEDTGERDIAEPPKNARRRQGQGQQRRTAAPAGGRQQAPAGAEQIAARANTLLARLPKDVADELRKRHTDPNELLRRTTEELNRRNAARTGDAGTNAGSGGAGPAQPAAGQPGGPQTPAEDAGDRAQVEKHIADGMRALKLSPDEQTALRNQFQGKPYGLLQHIKALYSARQDGKSTS
jgi:hypothetical protein